jgi:hypothetical protein
MNKVTVVKLRNYTIISNDVLRDKRLSLKAKGLLITVLGLPDTWDFSIQGISTILKEGRDSVTAAISELIEFGYCSRTEERDSDGTFIGTDYTFYEAPIIARVEPQQENPYTDNPITENPTQVSKEEVSTQRNKRKKSPPKRIVDETRLKTRPDLTDGEYIEFLEPQYPNVSVKASYDTMIEWCERKSQTPSRLRLLKWLEKEVSAVPMASAKPQTVWQNDFRNQPLPVMTVTPADD